MASPNSLCSTWISLSGLEALEGQLGMPMSMILQKFIARHWDLSLFLVYGNVFDGIVYSAQESPSTSQSAAILSAANKCPTNLSYLQPNMKKALQFVKSASFRNAMLASLQASIPQAIAQSDGLTRQIAFLKQEIGRQEQERAHAEKSGTRRTY